MKGGDKKKDDDHNNNNNTTKATAIEYYYNNKEIEAFIESDYINIKDGEPPRTLEFLKNREKVIDKPDFNGKPTISVQFIVVNPDDLQRKGTINDACRKDIQRTSKSYIVLEIQEGER